MPTLTAAYNALPAYGKYGVVSGSLACLFTAYDVATGRVLTDGLINRISSNIIAGAVWPVTVPLIVASMFTSFEYRSPYFTLNVG